MPRAPRRALRAALAQALAGEPGPWHVRVSTKLVYLTPTAGCFWIKLTLTSPSGASCVALLDPDKVTPEAVAEAIAAAVRGSRTS